MNWYLEALKKYAVFSGRARRKEFWMFILFYVIFLVVAIIIDTIAGTSLGYSEIGIVYILYSLVMFLPVLGVTVRRLHDTNRSGWWVLIELIPIIGAIILLVFTVQDSDAGDNRYGANPKTEKI